jgi:hypothetical protein
VNPDRLDDEALAALRRAAVLAGDPELRPRLERLITIYIRDRALAGKPETTTALRERLGRRNRAVAGLRRELARLTPLERLFLGDAATEADRLAAGLSALEQRLADIDAELARHPARQADRVPGGPRWTMLWEAAGIWTTAGRTVTIGAGTKFHEFATALFHAAGEEPVERVMLEVSRTWRDRACLTPPTKKSRVASSAA